jgi:hypothetical protein
MEKLSDSIPKRILQLVVGFLVSLLVALIVAFTNKYLFHLGNVDFIAGATFASVVFFIEKKYDE